MASGSRGTRCPTTIFIDGPTSDCERGRWPGERLREKARHFVVATPPSRGDLELSIVPRWRACRRRRRLRAAGGGVFELFVVRFEGGLPLGLDLARREGPSARAIRARAGREPQSARRRRALLAAPRGRPLGRACGARWVGAPELSHPARPSCGEESAGLTAGRGRGTRSEGTGDRARLSAPSTRRTRAAPALLLARVRVGAAVRTSSAVGDRTSAASRARRRAPRSSRHRRRRRRRAHLEARRGCRARGLRAFGRWPEVWRPSRRRSCGAARSPASGRGGRSLSSAVCRWRRCASADAHPRQRLQRARAPPDAVAERARAMNSGSHRRRPPSSSPSCSERTRAPWRSSTSSAARRRTHHPRRRRTAQRRLPLRVLRGRAGRGRARASS